MNDKLKNYVEIQAEKAENLSFCRGLKLLHVRDQVEEILGHIGKIGIFEEYTVHNISHIDEMLGIIEWLIPDETKKEMTSAEWLMLTLAVYFHDLGMVVTKDEYEKRETSSFKNYKNEVLSGMEKSEYVEFVEKQDEYFLYQEFVRENHARRIKQWIEGSLETDLGDASTIKEIIEDILKSLDKMFKVDLAMICESHHEDDIDDFTKYRVDNVYGNDKNEKVNLNYIAVILRIADLLHITKDRTPSITRKMINVSNPMSVVEWEKQMAVRAVQPKLKRDGEENIDEKLEKDTIEITAYFEGAETAEAYFGLSSYLQYTRKELQKCNEIVEKARKKEGALSYKFPWREIDETRITVIGFETKKLQFTIAQENILQLLVGHTLYNDSSVVVRELVQNAIDAVKLQKQYENKKGRIITQGKVQVDWNEEKRELSFWDNGTGMTISDVENYLLKVGASKYRDDTIKKEFPDFCSISHFGIGILTCFMIANDIDIVTNSEEQNDVNSINLRKVNGSYLLRRINKSEVDKRIKNHGTMVKLYVRNDVDMSTLEDDLCKWIVLPEIPVFLTANEQHETRIGYDSLKDVLTKYLNDTGRNVDGEKYDVYEENQGNVSVAYGYYDQKSDTIKVNMDANATVGDILATVDHEATHLLSQLHKNRVGGVKNPDILYGNVGMNEGITEMYSIKNMQSINPEYKSDSYVDEVEVMKEFEKICGEKNLLYAYMHNDLSYIREDMNQCIGNKKAFEKFCNDLDILYHYNYVDPDSVKAVFERQSAKQRIYQKLKKYQMGKKNAIREANYKTQSKDIPYSGSRESKNATSEYRIKFHKKEQETSITKNDDDFVNQKDKHRSFVESYYGGISLEKQKATVDDWIERQKTISSASSGGDPYKEERELSLPER